MQIFLLTYLFTGPYELVGLTVVEITLNFEKQTQRQIQFRDGYMDRRDPYVPWGNLVLIASAVITIRRRRKINEIDGITKQLLLCTSCTQSPPIVL